MAQRPTADFNIDPNITSGTDLANILNRFQDAIDSGNSGASRPAYLAAGGLWVREGDPMRLYLYDGTTDRELYNTTDGIVGALEDGTVDGQITTWNASSGEWTPEDAVVVSGGNVGIGTDSPEHNLSVVSSTGTATIAFKDSGTADQGRVRIRSQSENLELITGGGVRQTIDADGTLKNNSAIQSILPNDGGSYFYFLGAINGYSNGFYINVNNGNHEYQFLNGPSMGMKLDSTGRLGIGGTPSRSTKEIEEEAEATLRNWDSKDKKPTKAELIKRLTERNIGGGDAKLQVDGDGYFSGDISSRYVDVSGQVVGSSGRTGIAFSTGLIYPSVWTGSTPAGANGTVDFGSTSYKWKDGHFSGDVYANGSPLTRVGDIVETFRTLKNAVSDETTVEGIKEALTNSLGGLIEKFEAMQSAATQEIES